MESYKNIERASRCPIMRWEIESIYKAEEYHTYNKGGDRQWRVEWVDIISIASFVKFFCEDVTIDVIRRSANRQAI